MTEASCVIFSTFTTNGLVELMWKKGEQTFGKDTLSVRPYICREATRKSLWNVYLLEIHTVNTLR